MSTKYKETKTKTETRRFWNSDKHLDIRGTFVTSCVVFVTCIMYFRCGYDLLYAPDMDKTFLAQYMIDKLRKTFLVSDLLNLGAE